MRSATGPAIIAAMGDPVNREKNREQEPAPASEKAADAPPTSRLGRLARLGALAPKALPLATHAVKAALGGGKKAPPPEDVARREREELAKSAKKTAEAFLKTLGEMKGLPLKLGQMASYIDGLAPPGYEEKFQEVLKRLQAKAPPLSASAAAKVVTEELGAPPAEVFATWEAEPFAAASIGQVHRATTRGGERVAVKVQYPGIDKAIENDLKSIGLLESMIAPFGRKYHTKETLDEIRAVFLDELDYRKEAENAELFRRIHAGDDDVHVPRVVHSLSSKRVVTAELVGGLDYDTFVATASEAARDRASQAIFRFMFRALLRHGVLYADPHPGNYRFAEDGQVTFLDYGCVKILSEDLVLGVKRYVKAARAKDWPEFERACVEVLGFDPSDPATFRVCVEYTKLVTTPLVDPTVRPFTKAEAREAVTFLVREGKKIVLKEDGSFSHLPKPIHMPQEQTFMNRLQWGLASVLAGLGGKGPWGEVAATWIDGPYVPPPR